MLFAINAILKRYNAHKSKQNSWWPAACTNGAYRTPIEYNTIDQQYNTIEQLQHCTRTKAVKEHNAVTLLYTPLSCTVLQEIKCREGKRVSSNNTC